jgi:hypothetical protein
VFAVKVEIPADDVKRWMRKKRNEIYGSLAREQQIRVWPSQVPSNQVRGSGPWT